MQLQDDAAAGAADTVVVSLFHDQEIMVRPLYAASSVARRMCSIVFFLMRLMTGVKYSARSVAAFGIRSSGRALTLMTIPYV